MRLRAVFVLMVAGVASGCRQSVPGIPSRQFATKAFVVWALQTTLADSRLGELASRRGSSPDTRALGLQMAKEQAALHADFVRLAGERGIAVPTVPDERSEALKENLLVLTGSNFDQGFTMALVYHSGVMLRGLDGGASAEPGLQDLATRDRPVIEQERAQSKQLLDRLGGSPFGFTPDAGAPPPF